MKILAVQIIHTQKRQQDAHCPRAIDFCTLEESVFVITDLPTLNWRGEDLAEVILERPLSSKEAFVLLLELMVTLQYLNRQGIFHGAIIPSNITVHSLSPEHRQFVIVGLSEARKISDNFQPYHETDVRMALQAVLDTRPSLQLLEDPFADALFAGAQRQTSSTSVLAYEIRKAFDPLNLPEKLTFPFGAASFSRSFPLNVIRGRWFQKSDLAAIVRASFAEDIDRARLAYKKVMKMNPDEKAPGPAGDCILSKDAESVLLDLGCDIDLPQCFYRPAGSVVWQIDVMFHITVYKPLNLWNISRLLAAKHPTDSFDIQPEVCLRVLGENDVSGFYVDSQTFLSVCNAMQGSMPPSTLLLAQEELRSDVMDPRLPENSIVLAERRLFNGIAFLDASSRTVQYGTIRSSDTEVLQLCEQFNLEALKDGILKSRDLNGEIDPYKNCSAGFENSELGSCPSDPGSRSESDAVAHKTASGANGRPEFVDESCKDKGSQVQQWVEEQVSRKRKRYLRPNDIVPTRWSRQERSWTYSVLKDSSDSGNSLHGSTAPGSADTTSYHQRESSNDRHGTEMDTIDVNKKHLLHNNTPRLGRSTPEKYLELDSQTLKHRVSVEYSSTEPYSDCA